MDLYLDLMLVIPLIVAVVYLSVKNFKLRKHIADLDYRVRAYEEIMNHTRDIVWLKGLDLKLQFVNKSYYHLFPLIDNFIGLTDDDLVDKFLADGYRRDDEYVIKTGKEYRYQENDKGNVWFETVKLPVKDELGKVTGCAGIAHDITDRKEKEIKIYEMEHLDYLTGLGNRQSLVLTYPKILEAALNAGVDTYLIMVCMDNFKMINASYGFMAGDEILRQFSCRLRTFINNLKSKVARVGGDEFCIVIENHHHNFNITEAVENLRRIIDEPFDLNGSLINITCSIGISTAPGDTKNFEDMFKYAEICIRLSKKKGRHIVMYYSDIAGSVEARNVKIECEMLGAIKNGEFKVVYQPKINADDNTLLGTEALIRWHNSTLGDIEPREFIPLAEENGVIIEMGYWIIEKCITQNLEWGACGYDMKPISVNLTKKQFLDPNLISAVAGLCSKYNYPTGLIEFETTESIFSADYPLAKKTAQALHELGISLTLDDFGTSFSNMIEITSMCINTLKLKRNFVRDIDSNLGKQEVVRTLYNLSKRFDLHLIAEGVETSREFNKITGIGIKSIQGFYYSRPLPPNEFEQYIGDRRV